MSQLYPIFFSPTSSISNQTPTMFRSRQLRAERFKLLAKHKQRRLKEQREIASLHRKIRRADASDLSRLKTLDSLLDRPEPDLRHVMEHILTDRCYAGSPYLLMHCLRAIQRTPDPPPQAIPKPDPCGSDSDEPRAKTESVDDAKAIQEAMSKVPEDYLRALIKLFAISNDDFMHNVWDSLEKRYKQLGERFTTESIDPRPKRAAIVEDASVCDKCHNAFLQSENGAESCLYHFRKSVPSCLHGRLLTLMFT